MKFIAVRLNSGTRCRLLELAGWTTDSPNASFSLLACRGELLCYFPFHTSVRGQTQTPPPTEMPLFWGCIPCLEWGWTTKKKKLYETASAVRNKQSTNELDEHSSRWTVSYYLPNYRWLIQHVDFPISNYKLRLEELNAFSYAHRAI